MNQDENRTNEIREDESSIFGRSMSRDEIRRQKAEEKQRQKEENRRQRAEAKALRKAEGYQGQKTDLIVFASIVAVIVAVAGVILFFQLRGEKADERYEQDTSRPEYFADFDTEPDMAEDGLSAVLNGVYFTKGGHLCVEMTFGNGMAEDHHPDTLYVEICDGDTEAVIASGYTNKINDSYYVPAGGTNTYTFYISPEFVQDKENDMQLLNYSVKITSSPVETQSSSAE